MQVRTRPAPLTNKPRQADHDGGHRCDESESVGYRSEGSLVCEIPADSEKGGDQSTQDVLRRNGTSAEDISHTFNHDDPPFLISRACLSAPIIFGAVALVAAATTGTTMMVDSFALATVATVASYVAVAGLHAGLIAVERRFGRSGLQALFLDEQALRLMRGLRLPLAVLAAALAMVGGLPIEIAPMLGASAGVACAWSDMSGWVRRSWAGGRA